MRKVILVMFILFLAAMISRCFAQKIKQYIPAATFTFLSGITDGFRDAALFRFDGKGQWFNGKVSWTNKYKNHDIKQGRAFFGSENIFVFTTDCAHASNLVTHQFTGLAMAYMPEDNNKRFFHVFLKVAAYNVIREIGHSIVYSVIFKPQGRD